MMPLLHAANAPAPVGRRGEPYAAANSAKEMRASFCSSMSIFHPTASSSFSLAESDNSCLLWYNCFMFIKYIREKSQESITAVFGK